MVDVYLRPQSSVGFLVGEEATAFSHQLGNLGERRNHPQWGSGRSAGAQKKGHFTAHETRINIWYTSVLPKLTPQTNI